MAQDEDVFSQADALMRRHRSFIARGNGAAPSGESPAVADQAGDAEIPLLTEIVELTESAPTQLAHMQQALESEFELWLAEALPQQMQELTDKIGTQLLASLSTEARASLLPRLLAALADKPKPDQA